MSIYNISNWAVGTTYNIYDIVKYGNYWYYSLVNTNLAQTPASGSTSWGGVTTFNLLSKPNFHFKPSYGYNVDVEGSLKTIKYGEGYEQRIPDGINNILLKIDLVFDLRGSNETQAISHFLEKRCSLGESFVFTPLAPFNLAKLFYCRNFAVDNPFFENFTIKARFEEVPN